MSMVLSPATVMQVRLASIYEYYKGTTITVLMKTDTAVSSNYGERTKTTVSITTQAIINNVEDSKVWAGSGIAPSSNLLCKIWSLTSGGVNYLTREYFTNNRRDNINVLIGDIYYKVVSIQSPQSIRDTVPYWVMVLEKVEHAPKEVA